MGRREGVLGYRREGVLGECNRGRREGWCRKDRRDGIFGQEEGCNKGMWVGKGTCECTGEGRTVDDA